MGLKSASQSNRAKEKHSPGLTLHSSHDSPTSPSVRFEGFAPRIKVEELLTARDWGCLESQLYLPKPYVKATLSHPTPTTDISYFTVSSGTEFFQKPLILIREGKPGAARMTCHFRANRNKNFLISNSMLSKQRNWGSRQTLARGQLNCLGGTAPQVRRGIEAALRTLGRGVPRPPRPGIASHLPAQQLARPPEAAGNSAAGCENPFPPARTHDLEPVQSARLLHCSPCASPGQGRGPPSGVAREKPGRSSRSSSPLPTGFSESREKKNGSRSITGEGAQGQGPGQPGDGGGSGEGDPSKRGKRGLQSEKEAAGGTEVEALRLTKPAEGAALWLPVLRAPPREPRSPAAPSGSPAPPPLWEATWTCRFGPSAKSRLQGGGSPPPRPGFPASLRPMIGGSQCAECR